VEWALVEVWRSWGIEPTAVMGHSVGEYVAACVAGVFSVEDALRLVSARGRLMGALPAGGAMWAVGASEQRVREALPELSAGQVSIAAINGPEEVVVSGAAGAVEEAARRLEAGGARVKRLSVSHAFHSALMEPAMEELERRTREVTCSPPRVALVSNVTGTVVRGEVTRAAYWRRHARDAVRFADGIATLYGQGCRAFLEVGPTATLTGAGRLCVEDQAILWQPSLRKGRDEWAQMLEALSQLYVRGTAVDWEGFDRGYSRRKATAPRYPFERQRCWFDATAAGTPHPAPPDRAAGTAVHPLLGHRLRSALDAVQFEARIGAGSLAYLADHRKYGAAVLPATAYLEAGLAAAAEVWGPGDHAFEDLVISEPLVLGAEDRTVQVVFEPDDGGSASFQLFAMAGSTEEAPGSWRLYATGTLRASAAVAGLPPERPQAVEARCHPAAVEAYYEGLAAEGHDYGPCFRGIEQLWRGDGEALARIRLPEPAAADASYRLHPALLDAGLQVVGAALPEAGPGDRDGTYLPVSLDGYRLHRPGAGALWSHVQVQPSGQGAAGGFTAFVRLLDEAGELVAEVKGLRFARARRDALRVGARGGDESLYTVSWPPQPRPSAAPAEESARTGAWLVLADRSGLGNELAARLAREGNRPFLVVPDEDRLTAGGESLAHPGRAEDFRRLCARACAEPGGLRGVVHLWSLDVPRDGVDDPSALEAAMELACGSLLHLVQAMALTGAAQSPRLWVMTRGAQAVGSGSAPAIAQAPAWGLARTIAAEHPELRCTCVDLDPEAAPAEGEALWAEVAHAGAEDQIALRADGRHVARLTRWSAPSDGRPSAASDAVQLEISTPGVLDNLRFEPQTRVSPGPGQVEIRVAASALNFRDVLLALGMYDGEPGPLGREVAGTVTKVGPEVQHVAVGQEVVAALTVGGFRTYALAPAALVAPKPPNLSAEEAASIPIAFLTAEYALGHLARLGRGERVLIHAAAGGVGLAAVQLAQRAGAEVFATASSPAKRDFLSSLGVRHVMNSRSLDFAGEVRSRTGGEGVDVVLNSLAGEFIPKSLHTLRPRGRFVEIGRGGAWTAEKVASARPDVAYFLIGLGEVDHAVLRPLLGRLLEDFAAGRLRPPPRRVFPFGDAVDAFRCMAQARHVGKIVLAHPPADASHGESRVRPDATYLVTGGLGAIGRALARWLVERGARNLVLVGRHPPSAEAAQVVAGLERTGARVITPAGDVADPAFVSRLLSEVDHDLPALRGVVHAAGVLDDGVLVEQEWSRFREVLAPKAVGAWVLHRATEGRPLDFFVMFSSMVSQLAGPGQGSYAAANAFLDALAHQRRAAGRPALTVNWGPWAVGMASAVDARDRLRWREQGLGAIEPERGLATLGRLLCHRVAQVSVLPIDWRRRWRALPADGRSPLMSELFRSLAPSRPAAGVPRVDLVREAREAPPNGRRNVVLAHLRQRAVRVLGIDAAAELDPRQPLSELGLDSLMAVELRNALGDALGRPLPATLLFKYPSLEALTGFVMEEVLGLDNAAPVTEKPEVDDPAVVDVEQLSPEEARRLLAEELQSLAPEAQEGFR
jgi:acyl transferase domain-containing protein/acyl carrier protein